LLWEWGVSARCWIPSTKVSMDWRLVFNFGALLLPLPQAGCRV
jgi:hypothetical protein